MAGVGIVIAGQAFVCQNPAVSIFSNAQNRLLRAQLPVPRVIQDIALEGARGDAVEADATQLILERRRIRDAELDLDLDRAHGMSIVLSALRAAFSSSAQDL